MSSFNVGGGASVSGFWNTASAVHFLAGGGTFTFKSVGAQNHYDQPITGFGPGDHLIGGAAISGNTGPGTATVSATQNPDGTWRITITQVQAPTQSFTYTSVTLDPGVNPNTFTGQVVLAGGGYELELFGCFLPGTLIETSAGEVAVESLSVGDKVLARVDGQDVHREITWIGKRGYEVNAALPVADAGYPVRVLKDAFADGAPHKDMLITPEHCVFFEGKLVPVRMLVNGRTVFYDTSISAYDFYHVETEEHSLLRSDGVLTESYLDTGNRFIFSGPVSALRVEFKVEAGHKSWEQDAAAPLAVDRATVEPIWHMLAERAGVADAQKALVSDPDLHLVTDGGQVLRPVSQNGGLYGFTVPAGVTAARLVSLTMRPADVVGPFLDDRRDLGVFVGKVSLSSGSQHVMVSEHLSGLAGWYGLEGEGASFRWTNGNAALPLMAEAGRSRHLEVEVIHAGPYRAEAAAAPQDIRAIAA